MLAERTFLAGERFTAADVMMGWVIEMIEQRGDMEGYENMARYLETIRARPAHQRAAARATAQD